MAKLSNIAILGAMLALFFAVPADAVFTYDTLALRQETGTITTGADYTSEVSNPYGLEIQSATDDTGNAYFLHFQFEVGDTSPSILISKVAAGSDTCDTVITVTKTGANSIGVGTGKYKSSIAVNRTSGAIYVALLVKNFSDRSDTCDTGVYLFTSTNQGASFTRTDIGKHLADTGTYGWIKVATFGSTASDSVFILVPSDTMTTDGGSPTVGSPKDSGVFLIRCSSSGAVVDSALIIPILSRADGASAKSDSVSSANAPSLAKMVAIGQNKVSIISMGVHGSAADTGIFYDTVLVTAAGAYVKSVTDTMVTVRGMPATFGAPNAVSIAHNRFNNTLVMYYFAAKDTGGVGSATGRKSGGLHRVYLAAPDTDYSSSGLDCMVDTTFSTYNKKAAGGFDSTVADLDVVIDNYSAEHIAIMMKNVPRVYYVKRAKDTTFGTETTFDTVAMTINSSSEAQADSNVAIIWRLSTGTPKIVWSAVSGGVVVGRVARQPEKMALAAGTNLSVSNGTLTTTTSSVTVSDILPVNDASTPQVYQSVLRFETATLAADSSSVAQLTSSFVSPTYTVTYSSYSGNGNAAIVRINTIDRHLALYARTPYDTDLTNTLSANTWDVTGKFGVELTNAQVSVLMGSVIILQVGDTAGNVYREGRSFADTFGVQVQFQPSSAFMRSLAAAGLDSMNLAVYSIELDPVTGRLTTDSDWTLVDNADVLYSANTYQDTVVQVIVSKPITHFSALGLFPGGAASSLSLAVKKAPNTCVLGRCMGTNTGMVSCLRSFRDAALSTWMGRVLTEMYYQLR